jgi:signal transduction histidine kinase
MDEKKIKKIFLTFVGISVLITLLGLSLSKGLYLVGILFAMILVLSYFTYLKMMEILNTQEILKLKNTKLQNSSKYKSEFLANMSHELRTPLNSLLILASDLAANKEKNLTSGQIESAKIIESGGHDLLVLINDILDLSKIEAGKMKIMNEEINLKEVCRKVENLFRPLVTQKNLKFTINVAKDCPEIIWSDSLRLNQILNNYNVHSYP